MAWSNSKIMMAFLRDLMNQTAAFDLDTHAIKATLYNNTGTPDQTDTAAHNAYNGTGGAWVTANEVTATGWPAGGLTLASVSSAFASNVYTFSAASRSGGASDTVTNAFGTLVYDSTLASPVANQGICFNYFGGANSVTGGTFTIVWNASGIFTLTC